MSGENVHTRLSRVQLADVLSDADEDLPVYVFASGREHEIVDYLIHEDRVVLFLEEDAYVVGKDLRS